MTVTRLAVLLLMVTCGYLQWQLILVRRVLQNRDETLWEFRERLTKLEVAHPGLWGSVR